jgi:hypothetical protein
VDKGQIVDPETEVGEGIDELRAALAGEIWRKERVYAVWFFVAAFILKVGLLPRSGSSTELKGLRIVVFLRSTILLRSASTIINISRFTSHITV